MAASNPPKKPAAKKIAATAPKPRLATVKPSPAPTRAKSPVGQDKAAAREPKQAPSPMNGQAGKVASKVPVMSQADGKSTPAPKEKSRKPKLVRDSFTMPEAEYAVLGALKKACLKAGFEVKKSQLLRVGVALIQNIEIAKLKAVLETLPPLKAGRPKKEK